MTALSTEIQMPETPDGKRLYVAFHSQTRPVGSVVMVHGLGEYSGRYDHVVEQWVDLGLAVTRFDLRGHGRSLGVRGYVSSFEHFLDDLSLVVRMTRERFPDLPQVVYGHSLGANIVANWTLRRLGMERTPATVHGNIVGTVLSSPWLKLSRHRPALEVFLIRLAARIWPWFPLPAYFRVLDLCRDPHAIRRYRSDPLIHHRITVNLAIQAYDAGLWALGNAARFPLPVLAIHGGQDRLTSPEATRHFCEQAPRAEFLFYEDLVHETHNEPNWRDVVHEIGTWIKRQMIGIQSVGRNR